MEQTQKSSDSLTSGSVWKRVVVFSLPFLLSYLLQTLYGMADLFIIGQFDSIAGSTAVANGSQIMHMITVMLVGLAMGATVCIGQAIGRGDKRAAVKTIGSTLVVFLAVSVAATLVLLLFRGSIVSLMSTPDAAVSGTVGYLTVCFIGIPFITAYNVISAIFRGLGDSKSPMYFVAVACAANIILDVIFMGAFKLGPIGAALGTTISQAISVIISLIFIVKRHRELIPSRDDLRPDREIIDQLFRIGLPVMLQDGFIQISFIIITIIANKRGLSDAAAVGIVEKIIGFIFLVPSSMLSTVSALGAQCIGAKRRDRARGTLGCAIIIAAAFGFAVSILMQFIPETFVSLFTDKTREDGAEVIRMGGQYLRGYVWDCFFAGIQFSFSGYFCAVGRSELSFMHNIISILLVRVPGAYLMSRLFADTLMPMGLSSAVGSALSSVICLIAFIVIEKKAKRSSV